MMTLLCSLPWEATCQSPPTGSPAMTAPAEVLSLVWMELQLRDKITISQVCARWRAVSLENGCLWAALAVVMPQRTRELPMDPSKIWPLLHLLLPRSRMCTITLHLTFGSQPSAAAVAGFMEIIGPHAQRVSSIDLRFSTPSPTILSLLDALPPMPSVKRVCFAACHGNISFQHIAKALRHLPGLQHLSLNPLDVGSTVPLSYKHLRMETLTVSLDESSLVNCLLCISPIRALHVTLTGFGAGSLDEGDFAGIAPSCAWLRQLTLKGLTHWGSWKFYALLAHRDVESISLHFVRNEAARLPGRDILAHLTGAVSVGVTSNRNCLTLVATDVTRRRRCIEVAPFVGPPFASLPTLWACLAHARLTDLTLDWEMMGMALKHPHPLTTVVSLTIVVAGIENLDGDGRSFDMFQAFQTFKTDPLPSLKELRFTQRESADRARISVSSIIFLVRVLRGDLPSAALKVHMDVLDYPHQRCIVSDNARPYVRSFGSE